ncbi:flagellar export protein FliJ [Paenibacillus yanchengensis]|uniref:Flagellar FliJ protein n=1 Tax=Paenibacillus yanchengensis TaxID=2035833 RepID=A0ABW4YME3_9BACL
MSNFQFVFQKIVDLKSSEKTQAEWLLSNALSTLHTEEHTLEQLQASKAEWEQQMLLATQNGASLAEIQLFQHYIEHLYTKIEAKLIDVKKAQFAVYNSRHELGERLKDEKVWLKTKERAKQQFDHSLKLKEQNELDELATARFIMSAP